MIIRTWILLSLATLSAAAPAKWRQSFDAGYFDVQGKWAGGSEIMHLAAHAESLYAANGYWLDARWVIPPEGQKQSAQVLRLDKAGGKWQVDLDLGKANDLGLEYMKGNILKSVSFSTTGEGRVLNASKPPSNTGNHTQKIWSVSTTAGQQPPVRAKQLVCGWPRRRVFSLRPL